MCAAETGAVAVFLSCISESDEVTGLPLACG